MNKVFLSFCAFLLVAGCSQTAVPGSNNNASSSQQNNNVAIRTNQNANLNVPPAPTNTNSSAPVSTKTFDNTYMSFTYPSSWTVDSLKSGAANVSSKNYLLYINPVASQASGAEGGRFAEIGMGAKGVDLVIKEQPGDPCGEEIIENVTSVLERHDWHLSSSTKSDNCNTPGGVKDVWYFSYVTTKGDGYFGDLTKLNPKVNMTQPINTRQLAITMTYQTANLDNFPDKDSPELNQMLSEMSSVVSSLAIKDAPSPGTTITYNNTTFGFEMILPDTWQGYTVTTEKWEGQTFDASGNVDKNYSGSKLVIHNPKGAAWQSIPIMIFTIADWQAEPVVSAAPIGPTELARNQKYVFALPPRWVGFTDTQGQDEAEQAAKTLQAK